METYDFECIDCEHKFDVSDAENIKGNMYCPKCGSDDLLDLCDDGLK